MKPFLPAIAWSVVIFILSVMPGINLPETWADFISWDKIGHLTVYGILTFLLLLGSKKTRPEIDAKITLYILLGTAAYGILLEIIQYSFFPGRYFEKLDILANIIGSFIGLFLFKIFKP